MDDFSGLEYDQESVCEDDVITKTNGLLSHFNLPTQVSSVNDITASLFVVLYESLFSDRLPGIVRQPVTKDDEINNCQMVIDVLSADVIKDNLSHIRGADIVDAKIQSINNLLDIFCFLYEYVIKQIESDVPTDTDEDVRSVDRQQTGENFQTNAVDSMPDQGQFQRNGSASRSSDVGSTRSSQRGLDNGVGYGSGNGARGQDKASTSSSVMSSRAGADTVPILTIAPSPIRPEVSTSLMGHGTLDSTADLIQEGERLERRFREEGSRPPSQKSWTEVGATGNGRADQFDFIGVRPVPSGAAPYQRSDPSSRTSVHGDAYGDRVVTTSSSVTSRGSLPGSITGPVYQSAYMQPSRPSNSFPSISATEPVAKVPRPSSTDQLRSTVGGAPYQDRPVMPYYGDPGVKGLSSSYGELHNMVQQTAAMTRVAISNSPIRRSQEQDNLDITDLSRERQRVPQSEAQMLARELNLGSPLPLRTHTYSAEPREIDNVPLDAHPYALGDSTEIPPMRKDARQVGFYPDGAHKAGEGAGIDILDSETLPSKTYTIPPNTDYRPAVRSSLEEMKPKEKKQVTSRSKESYSKPQPEGERERKATRKLKDKYGPLIDDFQAAEESCEYDQGKLVVASRAEPGRRRADKKVLQTKVAVRLDEKSMPAEYQDVDRQLDTENVYCSTRQEYLKKLYEEEFGEVVEEVKQLMSRDQQLMDNMEDEYRKLMAIAHDRNKPIERKVKAASKQKGFLLPTTKRAKMLKAPSTPEKKSKSSGDTPPEASSRPLVIGEDEELLPMLMEQFPHLHMSDHTWHELWRKGLRQIENLTQAYEENKRRKSKAQLQLEEAARKHEVLAAVVKKQIDHNRRMGAVKDQKRQQVVMKNKVHEKRVQSARARRYYNDYQVRARSKMLRRRSKEETVFRNLFQDGLAIQKERIQDMQRYAKEQREKQAEKRQNEIDSLENYYRDQFELLVGRLMKDREDMQARENAHQKLLDGMKRDLRKKMEKEIINIQNEMFRDDDDVFFRQLESQRFKQDLHTAKYPTRI